MKTCESLRKVHFDSREDVHSQLDVLEANSKVVKWNLKINPDHVTESVKERLQKILSERNDSSVYIYNEREELGNLFETNHLFKIKRQTQGNHI